jgi:hypothetical protein
MSRKEKIFDSTIFICTSYKPSRLGWGLVNVYENINDKDICRNPNIWDGYV